MNPNLDAIESDLLSALSDALGKVAKEQATEVLNACDGDLELAFDVLRAAGGEDGMRDVCAMIEAEMRDPWFSSSCAHQRKVARADAIGEDKFNRESGR